MFKKLLNRILPTPATPATTATTATTATPDPEPTRAETAVAPTGGAAPAPEVGSDDVAGADALIAEGNALEDAGQLEQATTLYHQAVAKAAGHARAHLNLGIALAAAGDEDGAIAAYEKLLSIDPAHPFGNYNYARLALLRGDLARAETLIDVAVRAKPDFWQALVVQSNVRDALGRLADAVESVEGAVRLQSDDAGAWFNLAVLLHRVGRNEDADDAVRQTLARVPHHVGALTLLARLLRDQGFATEALEAARAVCAADPSDWMHRSFELLLMIHADGFSAEEIHRRHVEFGVDLERAVPVRFEHSGDRSEPGRRLRVGYLSRDLHLHPVPFFFIPVLEQHDRAQVEVFCYSYTTLTDAITDRLRALSEHWREVADMTDTELADAIHGDGIDVLVDLVGHTGIPRLGVFSQKPAPVQVGWLGYLNTTGLTRIDFRLCDRRTDPMETAQSLHTERLVHMPVSQWCYRPMLDEPIAAVAPVETHGYVTFGSFNSALKVTTSTCRLWAEVLARVPDSRLIVANINSERKRDAIRREIAGQGVDPARVEFLQRVALNKYQALFNRVDVALDAIPYGGGTTTLDSLWMGVPVVAAVGETPVSRSAASILAALGLHDWIAQSTEDFVDVAAARADDKQALVALRRSLRPRLQASPLTDTRRFTRDLEAAYRAMWLAKGR